MSSREEVRWMFSSKANSVIRKSAKFYYLLGKENGVHLFIGLVREDTSFLVGEVLFLTALN